MSGRSGAPLGSVISCRVVASMGRSVRESTLRRLEGGGMCAWSVPGFASFAAVERIFWYFLTALRAQQSVSGAMIENSAFGRNVSLTFS